MEYGLLMFMVGIATGAGASAWLSARAAWISGVRRWKDRKHGRGVCQLTYRMNGPARIRPEIETTSRSRGHESVQAELHSTAS